MTSVAGYLTAQQLISWLGWTTGREALVVTEKSTPTKTTVEEIISEAEEEIEKKTRRNWRSSYKTINREPHSWLRHRRRRGFYGNIIELELYFQNVQEFTSGVDKIETWNGSLWYDLVANEDRGEAILDGAYFCEPLTGRLYIHNNFPAYGKDTIKVTYRYGEYISDPGQDIPRELRRAIRYYAGADLMETHGSMFQYTIEDSRGAGNYGMIADKWRLKADDICENYHHRKAIGQLG